MESTPLSYSLLIQHGDSIYAVRDVFGNRPLCIGALIIDAPPGAHATHATNASAAANSASAAAPDANANTTRTTNGESSIGDMHCLVCPTNGGTNDLACSMNRGTNGLVGPTNGGTNDAVCPTSGDTNGVVCAPKVSGLAVAVETCAKDHLAPGGTAPHATVHDPQSTLLTQMLIDRLKFGTSPFYS